MIEVLIVASNAGVVHITYLLIYSQRPPEERPHRRLIRALVVVLLALFVATPHATRRAVRHVGRTTVHAGRWVRWQVAARLPSKQVTARSEDREKVSINA